MWYLYAIANGAQVIYDTDDDNELHEPGPENRLSSAAATLMSGRSSPCLRINSPAPDVGRGGIGWVGTWVGGWVGGLRIGGRG